MTDPLSVSFGVAQLLSTTYSAIALCYRCGCSLTSAPQEAKALAKALQDLCNVLGSLQELVTSLGRVCEAQKLAGLIESCEETLDQASQRLLSCVPADDQPKLKRTWRCLKWPLKKDQTLELVNTIERQKSLLGLALTGFVMYSEPAKSPACANLDSVDSNQTSPTFHPI